MLSYTTIEEARGFAGTIAESRALTKAAASIHGKDTFLSHSSKDNDLVAGIIAILKDHGAKVYVDLGDDRLPVNPSVETAQVLKGALREANRFVVLVSPNSKGSIWIPWELGLADGQKTAEAVALFPVVQKAAEKTWTEQEYLGLYNRIIWGSLSGYAENVWMVYNHHKNTATELSRWLGNR